MALKCGSRQTCRWKSCIEVTVARRIEVKKPKVEASPDLLDSIGLERDQDVRFRTIEGGDWHVGKARYINKDGSLCLISDGRFRSIHLVNIQVKRRGPKGGTQWVGLETS